MDIGLKKLKNLSIRIVHKCISYVYEKKEKNNYHKTIYANIPT